VLGSKCNLKTHVRNLGYSLRLRIWGPKTAIFRRLRNLTATLKAHIFGTEHDIDNRASVLATRRGLLHRLKTTWTLVYKRLKMGPSFYQPSVNSAFYFIATLRTRRSANRTQPNFAAYREVNQICKCVSKIWGVCLKNRELKLFIFVTVLISAKPYQMPKK